MGGRGSGGSRVGAGRKPKHVTAKILHGSATLAERLEAVKSNAATAAPVEHVDPPRGMRRGVLITWRRLAPHATAARTLTAATAAAFRDLCEAITIRDELLAQLRREGWTFKKCFYDKDGELLSEEPKAHPLVSQHRAWKQRVDTLMKDFMLAPIGKELYAKEPEEKDPLDDFDSDEPKTTH